jgi:hypothetical protein
MDQAEFQTQIDRLAATYGKTHFGHERLALLWRKVKFFTGDWLRGAVDHLISSCRQAPLPSDFDELISVERSREWKAEKGDARFEINANYSCSFCKDTGAYTCTNSARPGVWAFRCHCQKGLADPRTNIPQYTQTHREQGFRYREMVEFPKEELDKRNPPSEKKEIKTIDEETIRDAHEYCHAGEEFEPGALG